MILILKMKHGDCPVYARGTDERDRAYLYLFNLMDGQGYYGGLDGDEPDWYEKAKQGDAQAARWLLSLRSDTGHQYEEIEVVYPEVP